MTIFESYTSPLSLAGKAQHNMASSAENNQVEPANHNDVSTQSASVSVSSRDNIDPSRPAELSRRCWGLDRPTWTHLLNDWWFWETGSVLLSCACIVAAVIILVRISGTPIRNWAFPIQPNSLISVFMTIAKSSILVPASRSISRAKWTRFRQSPHPIVELENYDEASRGR